MNKLTRALVVTGVAVATGATMAASPAAASPSSGTSASGSSAQVSKPAAQQQEHRRRDRIYDYYRSPRTCHRVGRAGVWQERWDRYRCIPVGGFHRGGWALKVYFGWDHDHDFRGPGGPGGFRGAGGPGGPGGFSDFDDDGGFRRG
ncbi:hypothetical protein AMIS_38530 [Actinoplanes missouriensis 431]|uniref:Secreted protein n=1 Tax=Actinoplanes missouriensis (strain ATCC 14538 / DSM 43046 / CBS 188.64 / JCM 3121 / NBRC 102363 / NCIMB 12654 / NRRL B-3342 / UNCC 431) TaxID=512565 RepID=I0H7T6_ACTM4|nr:hypothetical protein [Actinoplanes missouriensis]BAL89073.1 hypothetical protein AMIS_38530 [Actinoplanes missouriensis 431]